MMSLDPGVKFCTHRRTDFFIYFIIYVFGEEAEWCWWWDSLHFNKTLCWKEIQKQTKLTDHVFNCSCS